MSEWNPAIPAPVPDEVVADWLGDAQQYLEENGWWRGGFRGPNGRQACAYGAIMFSHDLGSLDYQDPRIRACVHALESLLDECVDLTQWNDSMAKNKQEVIDLMARAEKVLRTGFDPDKGYTDE